MKALFGKPRNVREKCLANVIARYKGKIYNAIESVKFYLEQGAKYQHNIMLLQCLATYIIIHVNI